MSAPPTYRSKGRSWVKLWVGEWLDGSTRYEMTGAQRAFWIDLLTLAGRSRVPGVVCANAENNGFFGYPVSRYEGILGDASVNVLETLKLFHAQGKVELIVTREQEPTLYAVKILSWERYQSEYMRQRKTRKGAPKVTPIVTTKNTGRCAIEGEVEGEKEGEIEVEGTAAAFSAIGFAKPFGHKPFKDVWLSVWAGRVGDQWVTELMEQAIQACQTHNIKVPPQFYEAKHDVEKRETATMSRRAPL